MSKIGMDFGTTNSTISFVNPENGRLDCFREDAGGSDYIPTVISYSKHGVKIGKAAQMEEGKPEAYSTFKLALGASFDQIIEGKTKTPHQVAGDYIKELLQRFEKEQQPVEQMVLTIPNKWYTEREKMSARDNIRTLLQEIGLQPEQFQFQSEPVAAAAYFCWLWQQSASSENPSKARYKGNLVVVDYGGGTLDITLCQVDGNNHVKVINSFGSGGASQEGYAGRAFQSEVIRRMSEENELELKERSRARAVLELEKLLLVNTDEIKENMEEYYIDPEAMEDLELYDIGELEDNMLYCRHLSDAFQAVNEKVLKETLNALTQAEDLSPSDTKIVMVGGFSNFCCVQKCVREHFSSSIGANDSRFPPILSKENRALAIAKGAALIAEGIIQVEPVFPYEMGFVLGTSNPEEPSEMIDYYEPVLRRGTSVEEYENPIFVDNVVAKWNGFLQYLRIYIGEGKGRETYKVRDGISELFGSADIGQEYRIGFSVDRDMIPMLHVVREGINNSCSLNKLIERIVLMKKS